MKISRRTVRSARALKKVHVHREDFMKDSEECTCIKKVHVHREDFKKDRESARALKRVHVHR